MPDATIPVELTKFQIERLLMLVEKDHMTLLPYWDPESTSPGNSLIGATVLSLRSVTDKLNAALVDIQT